MAIDWGAYDKHLRVGIDAVISPANPSHNDTTVDVTWKYYVGTDGWNFSGDSSTLHEHADGWAGRDDAYTNNLKSGSMLVGSHTETYSISYSSGSKTASATSSGSYNGANPGNSHTVNLPDRPKVAPSAGEAPVASSVTATSAVVSWSYPDDDGGAAVDNYQFQISTNSGFTNIIVDDVLGDASRTETILGLPSNTTMYARVRAHNSQGWGPYTGATFCSFTTGGGGPSVPSGVSATSLSQTTITFTWNAAADNGGGALTYNYTLATNSAFTTGVQTGSTSGLNAAFTGLTANTTYYFRVNAQNSLGTSANSTAINRTTLASTTYNEGVTLVGKVNNGFAAVGEKMVHLGIVLWRGKTTATTYAPSNDTSINMSTLIQSRGPHAPTYTGSGVNDFTIQYPGTYEIEFAFRFNESGTFRNNLDIYVNGLITPKSGDPKGGIIVSFPTYNASVGGPWRIVTISRYLDANDTLGWAVNTSAASSQTQPAPLAGYDLYAWAKVTMVGF